MNQNDQARAMARMEAVLGALIVETRAEAMTPEEGQAELASGKITVRGLLAGLYAEGGPTGHA